MNVRVNLPMGPRFTLLMIGIGKSVQRHRSVQSCSGHLRWEEQIGPSLPVMRLDLDHQACGETWSYWALLTSVSDDSAARTPNVRRVLEHTIWLSSVPQPSSQGILRSMRIFTAALHSNSGVISCGVVEPQLWSMPNEAGHTSRPRSSGQESQIIDVNACRDRKTIV